MLRRLIEASWDWPYRRMVVAGVWAEGQCCWRGTAFAAAFGGDARDRTFRQREKVDAGACLRRRAIPISYFVDCIRNDKAIERSNFGAAKVQVMEIWMLAGRRHERGSRKSCGDGR